jgi:Phage integrase family
MGKTATERMVPLHPQAAEAIRELQALARPSRGFRDELSGRESPWLFVSRGRRLSAHYLFEIALQTACERAGLLDHEGRAKITAHRFRHTVGTELVEGGAHLHTVMKMLGHTSTGMTLVYAHLSDATLREEYLKVLGPGAQIAGPLAATLRAGAMPPDSIAWLKANFFRTELELGHCLRLPEEGPCECDLYLTCAKFVTTPEYAPRLSERRKREIALAEDARERGFAREVERHECTRRRIEQLLVELEEALDLSP